jgi:hypothetical protein
MSPSLVTSSAPLSTPLTCTRPFHTCARTRAWRGAMMTRSMRIAPAGIGAASGPALSTVVIDIGPAGSGTSETLSRSMVSWSGARLTAMMLIVSRSCPSMRTSPSRLSISTSLIGTPRAGETSTTSRWTRTEAGGWLQAGAAMRMRELLAMAANRRARFTARLAGPRLRSDRRPRRRC